MHALADLVRLVQDMDPWFGLMMFAQAAAGCAAKVSRCPSSDPSAGRARGSGQARITAVRGRVGSDRRQGA